MISVTSVGCTTYTAEGVNNKIKTEKPWEYGDSSCSREIRFIHTMPKSTKKTYMW